MVRRPDNLLVAFRVEYSWSIQLLAPKLRKQRKHTQRELEIAALGWRNRELNIEKYNRVQKMETADGGPPIRNWANMREH